MSLTVLVMGLLAGYPLSAVGQDETPERGGRFRDPEFRQRMLDEFDKDGNGVLDDAERQEARETMRARREEMRERFDRGGEDSPRGRGRPEKGDRRSGRGPDGPRPRNLESLFEWFDANHDNMLSRGEFAELSRFVHERRHGGPPHGGPGERGFGRRGPEGPPPGEGFGRRGREGRPWGEGPGRRGPDGPPRGVRPGPPPPDGAEPALVPPAEESPALPIPTAEGPAGDEAL